MAVTFTYPRQTKSIGGFEVDAFVTVYGWRRRRRRSDCGYHQRRPCCRKPAGQAAKHHATGMASDDEGGKNYTI